VRNGALQKILNQEFTQSLSTVTISGAGYGYSNSLLEPILSVLEEST